MYKCGTAVHIEYAQTHKMRTRERKKKEAKVVWKISLHIPQYYQPTLFTANILSQTVIERSHLFLLRLPPQKLRNHFLKEVFKIPLVLIRPKSKYSKHTSLWKKKAKLPINFYQEVAFQVISNLALQVYFLNLREQTREKTSINSLTSHLTPALPELQVQAREVQVQSKASNSLKLFSGFSLIKPIFESPKFEFEVKGLEFAWGRYSHGLLSFWGTNVEE